MLTAILGGFDKKENTLAFLPRVNQHPQQYHSKKTSKFRSILACTNSGSLSWNLNIFKPHYS